MPAIVLPIQTAEPIVAQVKLIIQVVTEQLAMTLTINHQILGHVLTTQGVLA